MLGGLDPVIILQVSALAPSPISFLSGVPIVGEALPVNGVPLPIYLNENQTKIWIESESTQIDVATDLKYTKEGDLKIDQQAVGSSLTVQLGAKRDSPMLAVLLAFMDMCLQRVVQKEYAITYVNGPVSVFNGKIEAFSQVADRNTDRVQMNLVISRGKPTSIKDRLSVPDVSKQTGNIPPNIGGVA